MLNFDLKIHFSAFLSLKPSCKHAAHQAIFLLLLAFSLSIPLHLFPVSSDYFSESPSEYNTENSKTSTYFSAIQKENIGNALTNTKNTKSSATGNSAFSNNKELQNLGATATGPEVAETGAFAENSFSYLWLRLIVILGIFALMAFLIYRFVLRKYKRNAKESPLFHPVAQYSLAVNKQLKIVRIVNDYYLLAVCQDSISLLSALSKKETIDELRIFEESSPSFATKHDFFIDIFKSKGFSKISIPTAIPSALDITRNLREKIKRKHR